MTTSSRARHGDKSDIEEGTSKGFTTSGLNKLLTTWRRRIAQDEALDLTPEEREKIRRTGLHALRHTMATQAVDGGMPLAVVQQGLGHASLNSTTIYIRSEERAAAEAFRAWRKL
jgi:integrase